eukprot:TRINITY_DN17_c3_g1_i1.p1 TRINITY_DN17_c3_g1~~TRINITY_DN17_c3_g1_i1.p1  ORF type:complete len:181 (+),score=50.47 TRINITY_DN17_c3_g1_i1:2-544(+)
MNSNKGLRRGGKVDYEGVVDYGAVLENYEWNQTQDEVNITIKLPQGKTPKDIICDIKPNRIKLGFKGEEKLLFDGPYPGGRKVITDDSSWTFSGTLDITLWKFDRGDESWWPSVVEGEPEIDTELIKGSKYLDRGLLLKLRKQREEQRRQGKLKDNVPIVEKQPGDDELINALQQNPNDN